MVMLSLRLRQLTGAPIPTTDRYPDWSWPVIAALLLVSLTQSACSDFRAGQLYRTATSLGAQGEWDEALHYYERLWVEYPGSDLVDDARLKAARIYAGPQHNVRSAEDVYRDLVLTGSHEDIQVQALLELADLYAATDENRDRAIEVLELYLQRFPGRTNQSRIHLKLAQIYLDKGLLLQAMQGAQPFLESVDTQLRRQALLIAGSASEFAQRATNAVDYYRQAQGLSEPGTPGWIAATEGVARALEETGQWREALTHVEELRDRHPNPDAVERWVVAIKARHAEMNR